MFFSSTLFIKIVFFILVIFGFIFSKNILIFLCIKIIFVILLFSSFSFSFISSSLLFDSFSSLFLFIIISPILHFAIYSFGIFIVSTFSSILILPLSPSLLTSRTLILPPKLSPSSLEFFSLSLFISSLLSSFLSLFL